MAHGDIHNLTGTICKAKTDESCPIQGGHSKDMEGFIAAVSQREDIDGDRVKALIEDGTPAGDAVAIVRDGIDVQSAQRRIGFLKPEANSSFAGYQMTDERLDLHRVYPGERYYDADGNAYIVETAHRGHFATLNPLGADGVAPPNPRGSDGELRIQPGDEKALRRLEPPRDSRFVDGEAGSSESRSVKDLPREGSWPKSVSAVLNYRDSDGNPKSVELVAPVGRLTDKKRIEIGRELWAFTGKDPARFEEVSEAQQLHWINQRIMRREDYSWKTNDDGTVSYSHRMGSGGSYDGKDIKLLDI